MTQTMRAIQVHKYGGPEVLQLDEIPRPKPQAGEILVRIHAAGVLPIETVVRSGAFARFMPKTFPYIPGSAFAGVVEEVGAGVTGFTPGQAICGRAPQGSYAEYVTIVADPAPIAPTGEGYNQSAAIIPLAPMPKNWSFDEAATLSGGATTAWTSLFEDGGLRYGQRVLIHGAAGGVGLFAVQFARWKGAHVIGTASAANLDFVRSLGAETVIDYNSMPFEEAAGAVDLVLDTIGGETLERSLRIMKPGGTLVSIVANPPADLAHERGVRAIKNAVLPASKHLQAIVELIDQGHIMTAIRQTFPLSEAAQAHALSEKGHGRGRIVLHIAD